jgi:hypothetical protein
VVGSNFIRARSHKCGSACLNNLRLVDSAKQQWALETAITNRAPTWTDLAPYLGRAERNTNLPKCPDGGIYWIGGVTNLPTCSIGGDHALIP